MAWYALYEKEILQYQYENNESSSISFNYGYNLKKQKKPIIPFAHSILISKLIFIIFSKVEMCGTCKKYEYMKRR